MPPSAVEGTQSVQRQPQNAALLVLGLFGVVCLLFPALILSLFDIIFVVVVSFVLAVQFSPSEESFESIAKLVAEVDQNPSSGFLNSVRHAVKCQQWYHRRVKLQQYCLYIFVSLTFSLATAYTLRYCYFLCVLCF